MHITYIGLGKMGLNMTKRLLEKGHTVTAYDSAEDARNTAHASGASVATTIQELFAQTSSPRTVWLMVPHQAVEAVLTEITPLLEKGDTVIEGGNSPYTDTVLRAQRFEEAGIHFLDAGVSGGPKGARDGACIMVGGKKETYTTYETLFKDLALTDGYAYTGPSGSGHFVKMVHNGIEYGMMQALAEGFDILKHANLGEPLPLTDIAKLYNTGSVIESRLVGWLLSGYKAYGEELEEITGSAKASGEGLWTTHAAKERNIRVPVIEGSVDARTYSLEHPNYQGKVVSVMRNQFGGHDAKK
jgi:6-phosphogluconate dehydrogenase